MKTNIEKKTGKNLKYDKMKTNIEKKTDKKKD